MMRRLLLLVSLVGPLVAAPRLAPAQVSASPTAAEREAQQLREKGNRAMTGLHYREALKLYQEAYDRTHDPALLYNMARANESLENFPEAAGLMERFFRDSTPAIRSQIAGVDALREELRLRVTTLSLSVSPAGARVLLRGRELGQAPFAPRLRVSSGEARVEALLDGHEPFSQVVQLRGGEEQSLEIKLVPRDRTALLSVRSQPEGAQLSIDQKPVGMSPVEVPLEAGTYKLSLTKDGFLPLVTQVQLEAGQRRELTLSLERKAPLTSRWWFWTGLGVVVVSGAVVTYALLTERQPPSGTIEPGRVQNALISF